MYRGSFLGDIRLKWVPLSILKHMGHEISQVLRFRTNSGRKRKKKSIKPVNQEINQTVYMLSDREKRMINMTDTD